MKNKQSPLTAIPSSQQAAGQKSRLVRRSPRPLALEQRFMFDGAAAAEVVDTISKQVANSTAQADTAPVLEAPQAVTLAIPGEGVLHISGSSTDQPAVLTTAEAQAEQLINDLLQQPDAAQQLFALFNGGQSEPSAEWLQRADNFLAAVRSGEISLQVELRTNQELQGAMGAFTANGPDGQPVIYLNADLVQADVAPEVLTRILVEEFGHSIDAALNGALDTTGDEGQLFAAKLMGVDTSTEGFAADDDHDTLELDGKLVEVELATFNFVNAYEVTTSLGHEAGKESNTHDFVFTGLGQVNVNDAINSSLFSGNDVSAIGVVINGSTYYGWISRPIKVQGEVKGFYFWTDAQFTSLALAQADGNQDGDSTTTDNRGFILVVDQAYFNTLGFIAGQPTLKNIGSSSDRVDSALNSLIKPNSPPALVNDSRSVTEGSGIVSGNVLTNDTDPNLDSLTVTGFTVNGSTGTLGSPLTINGVGDITLNANGTYSFTPAADYTGPVPAITYTVSDGKGGTASATLSITITPLNDAPTSTDDAITVSQNATTVLGLGDFGSYHDADGDPLAKIVISSLPATGTLEYWNGSSWVPTTLNQEFTAAEINAGKLRLTAGTTDTAIGFKVSDGTATSAAYTLTVTVPAVPALPAANTDSGSTTEYVAKEAGYNEAGSPASGNVLTNDSGSSIKVTSVFNSAVAASGSTQIKGTYGTLTISANGSYSYAADNTNPVVDALNVSGELSESFSYTITDSLGRSTTSTLTVKVAGTNDAPVAADDLGSVKELYPPVGGNYGTVSGNVLTNDSDVDNGGLKVVIGASTLPDATTYDLSATSPIATINATFTDTGANNWASTVPSTYVEFQVKVGGVFVTAMKLDGVTPLLVKKTGPTTLTFDQPEALYKYGSGAEYSYTQPSPLKVAAWTTTINSVTVSLTNSVSVTSGDASSIQTGFVVTGTGVPANTTVTAISGSTITLSNAVQIQNSSLTFTDPASVITLAPNQAYLAGTYGYLLINEDGSYTYKLTSNALTEGQTYVETFNYETTDASGAKDAAVIKIRIDGTTNATAPVAANDSLTVNEDGGGSINILGNDTGTTTVVGFTWSGQTGTVGTPLTLAGIGTLTLIGTGDLTFDPVDNYTGPVPSVDYTASWGSNAEQVSATVSLAITPANDAPASTDDIITVQKNNTVLLTLGDFGDFSDPDGDTLTTVKITTLESAGTLEYWDGSSWQDVSSNQVFTVADIAAGELRYTPVTDAVGNNHAQIGFQVGDGTAYSSSNTLTVHVADATAASPGNPPVNTLPAPAPISDYQTITFTGLSVADADNDVTSVTLTVANGTLQVTGSGSAGDGTAGSPLVLTGTQAEINALLGTLVYTPATGFAGGDTLRMHTEDSGGRSDTDFIDLTVNADVRPLTVTGTTVNEASPYVQFQVTGAAGQWVSLELGTTGAGSGHAVMGTDFLPNLEYFNGSAWVAYTGGLVGIPAGGSLLVRTAVLQDSMNEGAETLELTARNSANTAYTDTSTIVDDGTGSIYLPGNNTSTPNGTGDGGYPQYLDDDRPITVNDITVNEASPQAVFTVSGQVGQIVRLSLNNGTATVGTDTGSGLQYYDGAVWQNYSAGTDLTLTSATLLVRTTITQDGNFEGQEAFTLAVTKQSSGTSIYGTGSIYDDGTGHIYVDGNTSGTPDVGGPGYPASLDDDRTISVDSPTLNEASNVAVFTLTGNSGQTVSLELLNDSSNGSISGKANVNASQTLKVWDGQAWVAYDPSALPTFNASGKIFVSVDIQDEQDVPYEGSETFRLKATLSGSTTVATGTATIVDDGSSVIHDSTLTGGIPGTSTSGLDDDRPTDITVTAFGPVNEASTYAMFTVAGTEGQTLNLTLTNGTAELDTGALIEFSYDGSTWTTYSAGSKPLVPVSGTVYVRTTITSEADSAYEGAETFSLVATDASNPAITDAGETSIVDDGTGTKFGPNMPAGIPAESSTGLDDDRTVTVTAFGPVNEASTYAMFTVAGTEGQTLNLSLTNGTAELDTGALIEFSYDGSTWTTYSVGSKPLVPVSGTVYVRTTITSEADSAYEGAETFSLVATDASNPAITDAGETSIVDDGTGTKFGPNMPAGVPAQSSTGLDDDRTVTVTAFGPVNEASTYAMFTVAGTEGQTLDLSLTNGTAELDTGALIEFSYDGSTWITYSVGSKPLVPASGTVYVRTTITSEADSAYEGAETFSLVATDASNPAITDAGQTSIVDDGTGTKFGPNMPAGIPAESSTGLDDDRTVTVTAVGPVNEASTHAMFTVAGTEGQTLNLTLTNGTAELDTGALIEFSYDGSTWTTYSVGSKPLVPVSGTVYVRTTITSEADSAYEGAETFSLVATDASNPAITDAGETSIVDDGTGTKFGPNMPAGVPAQSSTGLDDDRTVTVTAFGPVNEASTYAMFTVAGTEGQTLNLSLTNGTAELDTGALIEFSYDGSTWTTYSVGSKPLVPVSGTVYVRTTITSEADSAYEGAETFSLVATDASNPAITDAGETSIVDDGTGTKFGPNMPAGVPAESSTGLDDDRTVTVTAFGPVNEASTHAMFTVAGTEGQTLNLSLTNGTAELDTGALIEFSYDGSTWTTYSVGSKPIVPASGPVYVRTTITSEADSDYEGAETFSLVATDASNPAITDAGETSIVDDGTGTKFGPNMPGGVPAQSSIGLDDDRPVPPPPAPLPPPAPPAPTPLPPAEVIEPSLPPVTPFEPISITPASPVAPITLDTPVAGVVQDKQTQEVSNLQMPISDTYTSVTGFRVVVIEAPQSTLSLYRGVADQHADAGATSSFAVPYDAFAHTSPNEQVLLMASLSDGTKLPGWIQFDPKSGKFVFKAPAEFRGELKIKVIARDSNGNEVSTLFRFSVGEKRAAPGGRLAFSEQIRLATKQPGLAFGRPAPTTDVQPIHRAAAKAA